MAKASKKAAEKKAASNKGGTRPPAAPRHRGNSGEGSVPQKEIKLAKDESDYAQ